MMSEVLKPRCLLSFIAAFVLTACNNDNSSSNLVAGVYSGVAQSEVNDVISVKATVLSQSDVIVSTWDDREHQKTAKANVLDKNDTFSFFEAQYECQQDNVNLSCISDYGSFQLRPVEAEETSITEYIGIYSAIKGGVTHHLAIEKNGTVTMSTQGCSSRGELSLLDSPKGVALLSIEGENCNIPDLEAVAELKINNQSLFSIELESAEASFPQVWVKQ
ncbi:hypothetical protein [Vibrio hepatarius]|uniref:hypothetical protein n=1 Tax=Vibrio hepatarius TaxID=171383 RepID=UPI00142DC0FE|nr:hypothetical protein [Vibrio hepatarius]NIY83466.1 hypothetical protein [Vibrio hepatarius]NVJ57008.1 hypothetical protein [Vibrionaceae bacterium]